MTIVVIIIITIINTSVLPKSARCSSQSLASGDSRTSRFVSEKASQDSCKVYRVSRAFGL